MKNSSHQQNSLRKITSRSFPQDEAREILTRQSYKFLFEEPKNVSLTVIENLKAGGTIPPSFCLNHIQDIINYGGQKALQNLRYALDGYYPVGRLNMVDNLKEQIDKLLEYGNKEKLVRAS